MAVVVAAFLAGRAASQSPPPPRALDFVPGAEQGFGDRQNSWAWSMQWWQGHLYVGTSRATACVEQLVLQRVAGPALFPYPPGDPNLQCAPDPTDLPLQAEIWRWTPETDQWDRVYQSPNDLPNPDHPGKLIPRDMGFRAMTVHVEPDGTSALYVGGVSTRSLWTGPVPAPRILRSVDGVSFTPIPAAPGTVMGDLPRANFRSLTSFDGQLFVINGEAQGSGVILASSDPAAGNDAWRTVSPDGVRVFELEAFNGWLYSGGLDVAGGYSVSKTQATGAPPYTFVPVVEHGGHLAPPSDFTASMHVFNDRLYVGTGAVFFPIKPTEIVRIDRDDSWDLLVGTPRETPSGWKRPLSGLSEGFGNGFTDHVWRMGDHSGRLYVGTYDSTAFWKGLPFMAPLVQRLLGFDLYQTADGVYYSAMTTTGFEDAFSIGIRNFADTPSGLFVGTANPFYGLRIWREGESVSPIAAPGRLEGELAGARPVLSWRPVPSAARYRIWRAPLQAITLYPPLLGQPTVPGTFTEVATTTSPLFVDRTVPPESRFFYHVVAEDAGGLPSGPSNLVQVPSLADPATFTAVRGMVDRLRARGLFSSDAVGLAVASALQQAQSSVAAGDVPGAIARLKALQQAIVLGTIVTAPYRTDLEISIDKLGRRLVIVQLGLLPPGGVS